MHKSHTLPELDGHIVAFSEHGSPDGEAILAFHGGPGSKSKTSHAERFDLEKYHVVLFDQRGCGKSTPLGYTEHNTTDDLLHDAERIRQQLGIKKWFVSGSSWGSTLALLYAQKYPSRVKGMLLSSIFLANAATAEWSFHGTSGVAQLMPDVLEKRKTFLAKYHTAARNAAATFTKLLNQDNHEQQKDIAAGVINWESNFFSPTEAVQYVSPDELDEISIAEVKIFLHYEQHEWFLEENHILKHVDTIANIPTVIVHGRYDILCPLIYAYTLKKKLQNAELIIADSSGHRFSIEAEQIRWLAFDRFLSTQMSTT